MNTAFFTEMGLLSFITELRYLTNPVHFQAQKPTLKLPVKISEFLQRG